MAMLVDHLRWRYATKKMDPGRPISEETVDAIIDAILLAPTSSGLQPFEIVVVTNPGLRARIADAARGQVQITDGSHLLVFAAWDNYTVDRIDEVARLAASVRGESPGLDTYYGFLKDNYAPRDPEVNFAHAARQTYIALGVALVAAAMLEVDATPMEGFDPDAVDAILGLRERGLRSVVLMPLGRRDEEGDWLLPQPKVRKPRTAIVTRMD